LHKNYKTQERQKERFSSNGRTSVKGGGNRRGAAPATIGLSEAKRIKRSKRDPMHPRRRKKHRGIIQGGSNSRKEQRKKSTGGGDGASPIFSSSSKIGRDAASGRLRKKARSGGYGPSTEKGKSNVRLGLRLTPHSHKKGGGGGGGNGVQKKKMGRDRGGEHRKEVSPGEAAKI